MSDLLLLLFVLGGRGDGEGGPEGQGRGGGGGTDVAEGKETFGGGEGLLDLGGEFLDLGKHDAGRFEVRNESGIEADWVSILIWTYDAEKSLVVVVATSSTSVSLVVDREGDKS